MAEPGSTGAGRSQDRWIQAEAPSRAGATAERIGALCRLVFLFRLAAVTVTILYLPGHSQNAPAVVFALLAATAASFVPLRLWPRVGETLTRHVAYLVADLALSEAILLATGPDSPFFYVTVGSALLGGVIYGPRGAALAALVLVGGYAAAIALRHVDEPHLLSFQWLVSAPLLYPLAAAGGASVRRVLDRQAETEAALLAAERSAVASEERSRVAREMHDSLGKTLHGIALQARGLAARARRTGAGLEDGAIAVAQAAEVAAREARELIGDLRSDVLELPLGEAVRGHVESWAQASGVAAEVRGGEVDLANPGSRYELFCILKEALRNIDRHAHASHVEVSLERSATHVVLSVRDDGVGLDADGDPRALERAGHFGLIGMAERAERLAGRLELHGRPGQGTTLRASVPTERLAAPAADEEVLLT